MYLAEETKANLPLEYVEATALGLTKMLPSLVQLKVQIVIHALMQEPHIVV